MQVVMTRRDGLRVGGWGAVAGVALLAGCAGYGGPRTVDISEVRLVELMSRSFPRSQRYLVLTPTEN
ncbi:MAG: hypothetical protein Fur0019_11860 [Tibeticola sp.]